MYKKKRRKNYILNFIIENLYSTQNCYKPQKKKNEEN